METIPEMIYPTLEEVEKADRLKLAEWYRFLKSPGSGAIGKENFHEVMEEEANIMGRITERFNKLGGMNPGISKAIGWSPR